MKIFKLSNDVLTAEAIFTLSDYLISVFVGGIIGFGLAIMVVNW